MQLTTGVKAASGVSLDEGHDVQFTVANDPASPETFGDSGQALANSDLSRGVSLGDLDAFVATTGGGHQIWLNSGGLFALSQTLANVDNTLIVNHHPKVTRHQHRIFSS